MDALTSYGLQNHRPAIDEPANEFEQGVNDHNELQKYIAEVKQLLKTAEVEEREKRDAIAASLTTFFGADLKEGMNTYVLSNKRKLKFKNGIDRKIDESQVEVARAAYEAATDKTDVTFDSLLRAKYELAAAPFKKVTGAESALAISRMLVVKSSTPSIEVD
jgi:DNA-binding ferritin-like protein (Dps family)